MQGMLVNVYRSSHACTNGISERVDRLTVVGEGVPAIFSPSDKAPLMHLVRGPLGIPILSPSPDRWRSYMFGGNYACTSDSRFSDLIRDMVSEDGRSYVGPIMIFDRDEAAMANDPGLLYYTGVLNFELGGRNWSQNIVVSVEYGVDPDKAFDMIAACEFSGATRFAEGSDSWISPCGVSVSAGFPHPISQRLFEGMAENRISRHDVTKAAFEAWLSSQGN